MEGHSTSRLCPLRMRRLLIAAFALALTSAAAAPIFAALIGSPVQVKDVGCWWPDVCYNAYSDQYLVFWGDYNVIPQVRARRVDAYSGDLLGSEFAVSDWPDPYRTYMGDADYNPTGHEWFVAYVCCWPDQPEDIYAQRIDSSGNLVGSHIEICTDSDYQSQPAATYDSTNSHYLVTWTDWADVRKIRGRLFDQYGSPVGSQIQISDSSIYKKSNSACVYNPISNEFLVIWCDDRNWNGEGNNNDWGDIYAQRINASTGALIGGNYMVVGPEGTPYVPDGMDIASVVCNTQNGRYFVAVTRLQPAGAPVQGWVTKGRILNSDGSPYTGIFDVSYPDPGYGAGAVYNPAENSFVMSYLDAEADAVGQRINASGYPLGSPFKIFNSNYENNMGNLAVRASSGEMMQVTIWFEDKYTQVRYNILEAQRFDTSAIPPAPVSNFVAYSSSQQNNITWTNPVDSTFTGTMIRYRTDTYPTSTTDGTLVVDKSGTPGANDSYLHSGLTNGITYYYTAWAHDSTSYSSARKTSGTPTPSACFQDAFSYANGALNGNGGWSGSASSTEIATESETVRINGGATSYDAIHTVACGDPGTGYMTVIVRVHSGTGTTSMWSLWIDDPSALNLARWYGTGTTARGRIGATTSVTSTQTLTGGWDELKVNINPYDNTTEFFFNGSSIGVLSHTPTGAGDIVGRLRFERMDNGGADGNYLYFDNLRIGEGSDTTPPGPVTDFVATGGDEQNSLSWTNPTGDFTGTMIRFRTDTFPTSPTDGTLVIDKSGTPGAGDSYVHTGLANGTTHYYAAFAHDAVPNYASAANASATPGDTVPPGDVTGFNATGGDTQNSLSWTNPTDPDFAGVKIMFKTTAYPSGPSDGTECYNGSGTGTTHTGLTNGVTYYYKAFAYDEVPNYASGAQASATPAHVTPPGNVTSFTATSGDTQNSLSWTNPGDSDFAGVKIMFKTTGYPSGPSDGTECYNGSGTSTVHTGLTNGTTYYYKAFAYDEVPNYASGAQASATPADVTPPGNVTSFTATPGDTQNSLSWTNPGDSDFAGVKIMFKTTGYPTGPGDGTQCYDGNGTGTVHSGLTNGVTYYYCAYAYDEVPNYSSATQASATPYVPIGTVNVKLAGAIVIDGSSSDWSLGDFTTYARGGEGETGDIALVGYEGTNLYYAGYWTGGVLPTSASDHTAKVYTRHDSKYLYLLVRCDDSDIRYPYGTDTNWANDCAEFYIDPSHDHGSSPISDSTSDIQLVIDANNQKNVYMCTSGYASQVLGGVTSAVTTDGTGWWLEVRVQKSAIDPDVLSSGDFGVDFNFRDNDNNNDPDLTTVYCWNDYEQSGGFPSKIPDRWGNASLTADTVPPANVTNFAATPGDTQVSLSWTNPTDNDFAGVKIMFKTTGYPTGPTDGTQCYNGSGASTVHTGLTNGVTYYYAAFAYDEVPNYASGAQASATPVSAYCFRDQFSYPDGALNGNGGWSGSANSSQIAVVSQTVKIIGGSGSKDAKQTVSCSAQGQGYIWAKCKVQKGSGTATNWNLWINDSSGKNFARWYGTGEVARGRIGGTADVTPIQTLTGGWDDMDVKITPAAKTSEFFFNGTSIGTLSYASQGTGDVIAQLRFERGNNGGAAGQYTFFDDLRVEAN